MQHDGHGRKAGDAGWGGRRAPLVDQADGCAVQLALDGAQGAAPQTLGPYALDAAGGHLCLHLDSRTLRRAHFAADTTSEAGTASSFATRLTDATGATLVDGWNVTVDGTPPTTFENLEWSPQPGVIDVVLWVHASAAPATTPLALALFDPLSSRNAIGEVAFTATARCP